MKGRLIIPLTILAVLLLAGTFVVLQDAQTPEGREARRAYDGAPPIVPHELTDPDGGDCLDCHSETMDIGDGRIANPTPHPEWSSCLQCHAPGIPAFGKLEEEVESDFVGLKAPARLKPTVDGAPMAIPHDIVARKNCAACHAADHPVEEMRCDHLQRTQCLSCHPLAETRVP